MDTLEPNNINPRSLRKFLQALELKLRSSDVKAFYTEQQPHVRDEYVHLKRDVRFLVNKLTIVRLQQLSARIEDHSATLMERGNDLKVEIESLASARKILTRLDKTVSIVSRIALPLL